MNRDSELYIELIDNARRVGSDRIFRIVYKSGKVDGGGIKHEIDGEIPESVIQLIADVVKKFAGCKKDALFKKTWSV